MQNIWYLGDPIDQALQQTPSGSFISFRALLAVSTVNSIPLLRDRLRVSFTPRVNLSNLQMISHESISLLSLKKERGRERERTEG